MKKYLLLFFLLFSGISNAQNLYFPPLIGNTWDTISPSSLGWCEPEIDTLLDYLESNNTKAFILLKDGKIAIEKYFGTFTEDSVWYWASAAKTLTAFTVGIAQQENFLSITDTTSNYIGNGWTNCPTLKEEKITLRNQLDMTSGLDDGVVDNNCTIDSCLQYFADAGSRWAYHTAPYTLLDSALENATGTSLNNYISQKVKLPTGMSGSFFKFGYNNLFVSKPRSMARFGLLLLNQGNWNGNQILTDTAYFQQMINTSQTLNPSYGYLCWLNGKSSFMLPGLQLQFPGSICPNAPTDMYAALGANGQFINVVPSQNLVYIRMGDAPGSGEVPIFFNDTVWMKLNEVMCNTTSIFQINNSIKFTLSPNPSNGQVKVSWNSGNVNEIFLMDYTGRIVFAENVLGTESNLDISNLPKGMYFVKLNTHDGIQSLQRLIKN